MLTKLKLTKYSGELTMRKYVVYLSFLLLITTICHSTVYNVGPSRQYKKPSNVMPLVNDSDTVLIDAGVYSADVGVWSKNNLRIMGLGGMAHMQADGASSQGKAIWVITGNNTFISEIEFSGAKVDDHNGAGIRQEGKNLTILRCYFHDNENGILAGDNAESKIDIAYSEFANNGYGDGYTHNLYINHVKELRFFCNYSHHANVGHNLKSRALVNYVVCNRIMDEATGNSSYLIDLPNGGRSFVVGNLLMQGQNTENSTMISYGREGLTNPSKSLFLAYNSMVNLRKMGIFLATNSATDTAYVLNNIFAGYDASHVIPIPQNCDTAGNLYSLDQDYFRFVNVAEYDYNLKDDSPAIGAGAIPKYNTDYPLLQAICYKHKCSNEPRPESSVKDVGAYYARNKNFVVANNDTQIYTIYPNPVNSFALIKHSQHEEIEKIEVFDLLGQRSDCAVVQDSGLIKINTENLKPGEYIVRIISETGKISILRFIKY